MTTTTTTDASLTADEQALYDRQIRLWGAEAQQRLRQAKVGAGRERGGAIGADC